MKPDFEKSDNQKHKFHKISGIIFAAFIKLTSAWPMLTEKITTTVKARRREPIIKRFLFLFVLSIKSPLHLGTQHFI